MTVLFSDWNGTALCLQPQYIVNFCLFLFTSLVYGILMSLWNCSCVVTERWMLLLL